jgi:ATP-dependent DNA ligase
MPILLARDKNNKIRYWSVEVVDGSKVVRKYGQIDGKETVNEYTVDKGKGGRTITQQAHLEAASYEKKQRDAGFSEQLAEGPTLLPMLANKWEDRIEYIHDPFFVQPKLDGIRMMVGVRNGEFIMMSRTGKRIVSRHVESELKPLLREGEFVDGENYTREKTFEELSGECRLKTINESIKFHAFDFFSLDKLDEPFSERTKNLFQRFQGLKHVILVTTEILDKKKVINAKHDQYVSEGYEGIMIRDARGRYELADRSNHLLKYKYFQTKEYEIIEAEQDKDQGVIWLCSGLAKCWGDDEIVFRVRPTGTLEKRRAWYLKRQEYIGKDLTVQFQNLTAQGIPRFPVGIAIRDYE